jgi:hypothetical protein
MKLSFITMLAALLSGTAMANQPVAQSDVEARLDALEVIDVTAYKPPRDEIAAPDPELDAILDTAASAESQDQ